MNLEMTSEARQEADALRSEIEQLAGRFLLQHDSPHYLVTKVRAFV